MPVIMVLVHHLYLGASIQNLNMWPVKGLQLLSKDDLLQGLCHVQRVPLLRGTEGSVLLSVGARHVHVFLSAWDWLNLQGGGADALLAVEEDLKVLVCEEWVVVHDLGQVNQTNLESGLWRV